MTRRIPGCASSAARKRASRLELRPGELELVTGVLELALENALLADRLASFGRAGGLTGEEGEQDAIVVEEERPGIGMDDQPALTPQVGLDRKRDRGLAARGGAVARSGIVIGRPDLDRRRWRPVDDPDRRRRPKRDDRSGSVRDRAGRMRESDPQGVRVAIHGRPEEALAEIEGDRALLEPAQRHRRDERGEITEASHQGQHPRDCGDARVRRPACGRGRRSRSRHQDRDREADRRRRGDPQTRAGVADTMARGPEEQERRDRLDGEEVRDDEQRDRRVAARPDPDPDDRRPEPDQRRDRQRPGDADEMARESQRQVRLEQEDHGGHLVDPPRDARDELGHDRDREQRDDRREHKHQVAVDRPWVPDVVDQDHDEDQDERRLQSDIDGVHESLGTAPRGGWDRIDRTLLAARGAYRGR